MKYYAVVLLLLIAMLYSGCDLLDEQETTSDVIPEQTYCYIIDSNTDSEQASSFLKQQKCDSILCESMNEKGFYYCEASTIDSILLFQEYLVEKVNDNPAKFEGFYIRNRLSRDEVTTENIINDHISFQKDGFLSWKSFSLDYDQLRSDLELYTTHESRKDIPEFQLDKYMLLDEGDGVQRIIGYDTNHTNSYGLSDLRGYRWVSFQLRDLSDNGFTVYNTRSDLNEVEEIDYINAEPAKIYLSGNWRAVEEIWEKDLGKAYDISFDEDGTLESDDWFTEYDEYYITKSPREGMVYQMHLQRGDVVRASQIAEFKQDSVMVILRNFYDRDKPIGLVDSDNNGTAHGGFPLYFYKVSE
ncbi:MAG: hypothetical protein OCC49_01140 [Fibrobacterales bacterium]